MVPVLTAVAVAAAGWLAAAVSRSAPLAMAAVALAVWVPVTGPNIHSHQLPNEDVHSEVLYLEAHFRRGDVVIVNYGGQLRVRVLLLLGSALVPRGSRPQRPRRRVP